MPPMRALRLVTNACLRVHLGLRLHVRVLLQGRSAQSVLCLLSEKRGWPGAQQDAAAQRRRQQASGITRPLSARAGGTGGLLKPKPLQLARILHGLPSPLVSTFACNTASSHFSHTHHSSYNHGLACSDTIAKGAGCTCVHMHPACRCQHAPRCMLRPCSAPCSRTLPLVLAHAGSRQWPASWCREYLPRHFGKLSEVPWELVRGVAEATFAEPGRCSPAAVRSLRVCCAALPARCPPVDSLCRLLACRHVASAYSPLETNRLKCEGVCTG